MKGPLTPIAFALAAVLCIGLLVGRSVPKTGADARGSMQNQTIVAKLPANARASLMIDLGVISYGSAVERTVDLIAQSSYCPDIAQVQLLGCASCTSTEFVNIERVEEQGCYRCTFRLISRTGTSRESGRYQDTYALLDAEAKVILRLGVMHAVSLSTRIDPNRLRFNSLCPEQSYTVRLSKKTRFTANAVRTADSELRITRWRDTSNAVYVEFTADHTFEEREVRTDLFVTADDGECITVPLYATIKDFITVEPRRLFLGVIKRGHPIERSVAIRSARELTISRVQCDESELAVAVHETGDMAYKVCVYWEGGALRPGTFQASLNIYTEEGQNPIGVPIYGVFVAEDTSG
jgi:hypothetical protein